MPPRISHLPGRLAVRLAACCAAAAALMLPALAPSSPAATGHVTVRQRPESHAPRTLLVRFAAGVRSSEARALVARAGGRPGPAVGATGFVKVTAPSGGLARLARRLRGDGRVTAVALDDARAAAAQPNDPLWAPGLPFDDQDYQRNIRLPAAWDLSRGAPDETIAVVDTGVRADNPDLVGRVAPGLDVLDPGQPPDDTSGHGTMVAGIAAAATDDGILIAGVAWNATILPVKVMNGFGVGRDSDIAAGITWAADHGARVILLALAGPDDSPVLRSAVDYALGKDAVVVAAAGASAAPDGLPGASRPM